MKRYLQLMAVCFFAVLIASCDMAPYPIDAQPKVKVDMRLLGGWKEKGKNDEYFVIKNTDYTYQIFNKDRRNGDMNNALAYLSEVDNTVFLNVQDKNDTTRGYFFIKIIEINPIKNVVTIAAVKDSTLRDITDPAEVRDRMTRNANNPAFFSDTTYLYRVR